ncbi:MAG: RsmB/NOP family class I SAM-dependent RNA methyltransferase [bacterium]
MDFIDHAATVLRMFEIEPRPLDRLLDSHLRDHPEINSRQRRLISRAVYGVSRWRRRIDGCLKLAGVSAPDNRLRAQAFLRWRPCKDFDALSGGLSPAPELDGLNVDAVDLKGFPGGDAAYFSYPDFLFDMIKREYGAEGAREIALVLNEPIGPTLRVNLLRATRDEVIGMLKEEGVEATPAKRSPFGIRLSIRSNFRDLKSFREGFFEVQDEASQLASILADPSPGQVVLDACSGAGGKALALAMLMRDQGEITACDIDGRKLKELARRAERAKVKSIRTMDAASLSKLRASFDLVFIDAPCSGVGTQRRSPDIRWRLDKGAIDERVRQQKKILRENALRVKPGGSLLYATCSILREENEDVVADFLKDGGFEVSNAGAIFEKQGIACGGIVTREGYLKTDPRLGDWDGFFAALMRRG